MERGLQSASLLELEKRIKELGATVHQASMWNKFRAPKIIATARGAFGVRELAAAFRRHVPHNSAGKPDALHTLRENFCHGFGLHWRETPTLLSRRVVALMDKRRA